MDRDDPQLAEQDVVSASGSTTEDPDNSTTIDQRGTPCAICTKLYFPAETVVFQEKSYHLLCFKCSDCRCALRHRDAQTLNGALYCAECHTKAKQAKETTPDAFPWSSLSSSPSTICCPRCSTTPLLQKVTTDSGTALNVCQSCHGVWFDNGEVGEVFNITLPQGIANRSAAAVQCPRCDVAMVEYKYPEQELPNLDRCLSCNGVWFDNGEVAALKLRIANSPKPSLFQKLGQTSHSLTSKLRSSEASGGTSKARASASVFTGVSSGTASPYREPSAAGEAQGSAPTASAKQELVNVESNKTPRHYVYVTLGSLSVLLLSLTMTIAATLSLAVFLPPPRAPGWLFGFPDLIWPAGWVDLLVPLVAVTLLPIYIGWLIAEPLHRRGTLLRMMGMGSLSSVIQLVIVLAVVSDQRRGLSALNASGVRILTSIDKVTSIDLGPQIAMVQHADINAVLSLLPFTEQTAPLASDGSLDSVMLEVQAVSADAVLPALSGMSIPEGSTMAAGPVSPDGEVSLGGRVGRPGIGGITTTAGPEGLNDMSDFTGFEVGFEGSAPPIGSMDMAMAGAAAPVASASFEDMPMAGSAAPDASARFAGSAEPVPSGIPDLGESEENTLEPSSEEASLESDEPSSTEEDVGSEMADSEVPEGRSPMLAEDLQGSPEVSDTASPQGKDTGPKDKIIALSLAGDVSREDASASDPSAALQPEADAQEAPEAPTATEEPTSTDPAETESKDVGDAENIDDAEAVAATEEVGDAENIDDAEAMAATEEVGDAENIDDAEAMAATEEVGDAKNIDDAEAVAATEEVGDAEAPDGMPLPLNPSEPPVHLKVMERPLRVEIILKDPDAVVLIPFCRSLVWEVLSPGMDGVMEYFPIEMEPCPSLQSAIEVGEDGATFKPPQMDSYPAWVRATTLVGTDCRPDRPLPLAGCSEVHSLMSAPIRLSGPR